MEKRKEIARIYIIKNMIIEQVKENYENSCQKWNEMIEKGKEYREKKIQDYHHCELLNEILKQQKKKRIINSIKKNQYRMHAFNYLL